MSGRSTQLYESQLHPRIEEEKQVEGRKRLASGVVCAVDINVEVIREMLEVTALSVQTDQSRPQGNEWRQTKE